MTGSKHVTEKRLVFGAATAVGPQLCRVDVAGSEIPVTKDGVFHETNPFLLNCTVQLPDRYDNRICYNGELHPIRGRNGARHRVRILDSTVWVLSTA